MLTTIGLFAGIGGIEEGLRRARYHAELLCEFDLAAQAVLKRHFPATELRGDIKALKNIPKADIVAAGFPCQDLSQAGKTMGIAGTQSGLIKEVFRLIRKTSSTPRWLLLENVPFMLALGRGRAMKYITDELDELSFSWAYRVVDTQSFGLPQRRKRVLILASKTEDPRPVLLGSNAIQHVQTIKNEFSPCGFYWSEGNKGLGWAVNAIPALKVGSQLAIPTPPAIWLPHDRSFVLPNIKDAERLQGFPVNWTISARTVKNFREKERWRLVGNAVSVPVSKWIASRLNTSDSYDDRFDQRRAVRESWPRAGWGSKGMRYEAKVSDWPVCYSYRNLSNFLKYPSTLLSARATQGFLGRLQKSGLRCYPSLFIEDLKYHVERMIQIESRNNFQE